MGRGYGLELNVVGVEREKEGRDISNSRPRRQVRKIGGVEWSSSARGFVDLENRHRPP